MSNDRNLECAVFGDSFVECRMICPCFGDEVPPCPKQSRQALGLADSHTLPFGRPICYLRGLVNMNLFYSMLAGHGRDPWALLTPFSSINNYARTPPSTTTVANKRILTSTTTITLQYHSYPVFSDD
jgi:hypothetical protein